MDWNKAKTVLIIAFTALNIFLGTQLFQSWSEQARMADVTETSQQELEQLLHEKKISLETQLPHDRPTVSLLAAEITSPGDGWVQNDDGSYSLILSSPIPIKKDIDLFLQEKIPHFNEFVLIKDTSSKRIYAQYWKGHPLFDGKLEVEVKGDKIISLQMTHFSIQSNEAALRPVSARTALISLIEIGRASCRERV